MNEEQSQKETKPRANSGAGSVRSAGEGTRSEKAEGEGLAEATQTTQTTRFLVDHAIGCEGDTGEEIKKASDARCARLGAILNPEY